MPSSPRLIRVPALAVLACLALAALTASASPVSARAATTCKIPESAAYIGTAFELNQLTATSVSCAYARTLVHAYWHCFTHAGKSPNGHCTTKVNKFTCKEGKRNYGEPLNGKSTQFGVRVTCKRVKQRVVAAFTEYLDQ